MRVRTGFVVTILVGITLRYLLKSDGATLPPERRPATLDNEIHPITPDLAPVVTENEIELPQSNGPSTNFINLLSDVNYPDDSVQSTLCQKIELKFSSWKAAVCRAPKFSVLFLAIQLLSYPVSAYFILKMDLIPTDLVRRFFTGLFLTNTALVGHFIFEVTISKLFSNERKSPLDKKNVLENIIHFLGIFHEYILYTFLIIAGFFVFYVGWEGDGKRVGIWFGYGAVVAGFLFQFGFKRIVDFECPPIQSKHRLELIELLELVREVSWHEATHARVTQDSEQTESNEDIYSRKITRICQLNKKWGINTNLSQNQSNCNEGS